MDTDDGHSVRRYELPARRRRVFGPRIPVGVILTVWIILLGHALAALFSTYLVPYFAGLLEAYLYRGTPMFVLGLLFTSHRLVKTDRPWRFYVMAIGAVVAIVLFYSFFAYVMDTRERLVLACDGIVTEKCISNNHLRRRVVVEGETAVVLENLSDEFWNQVKIGDRVTKTKRNPFVSLNGQSVPMLFPSELGGVKGKYLPRSADEEIGGM